MRSALFATLLTLPTIALAQDASAPPTKRPTGTALLDALPSQADVVVDVPDLPALLDSFSAAGLGDAASWRAAFDAQLRAWGAGGGDPDKLVKGGGALLAAADGEAVAASVLLKLPDSRPQRATILAFRSTKDEATLRAAFTDLIDGGLKARYLGDSRQEEIAGRRVHVLYGNQGNLFIHVSNGFVAVCDHPLAIGLFFKGFGKDPLPAPENRPSGSSLKLIVRHGKGDAAWDGWIWGDGETVEWKADELRLFSLGVIHVEPLCAYEFAWPRIEDVPLLARPLLASERDSLERLKASQLAHGGDASLLSLQYAAKGIGVSLAPAQSGHPVAGVAWRLNWLRALASRSIPSPLSELEPSILEGPLNSAIAMAGDKAGEPLLWKSTQPGRLSGPLGHGPATFLALRCLHDIGHGVGPGEAPSAPEPEAPAAPLPPPAEPRDK